MRVLDRIILYLCTLAVLCISLVFIALPFLKIESAYLFRIKTQIDSNYLISVIAFLIAALCIKALIFGNRKRPDKEIVSFMKGGDLKITDEAVRGIAESALMRFMGIREHRVDVEFNDNSMTLNIDGAVTQDVNIPEITEEIQNSVLETIKSSTGMDVEKVNVKISRFSNSSVRTVR